MQNKITYKKVKITNPVNRKNANTYSGNINGYMFYFHHKIQLQQIQQTLPDENQLKTIYLATFVRDNNTTFLEFVACSILYCNYAKFYLYF